MMLRHKEVRQRLGISYAIIREYVKKGYIKPLLQSGKWRFREDVEKLMGIVRKRKLYYKVECHRERTSWQSKLSTSRRTLRTTSRSSWTWDLH